MDVRKQEGITIIEKIATPSNLMAACEKVHKGKGAASIDGITVYEIDGHMATRQKQSLRYYGMEPTSHNRLSGCP